MKYKGITYDIGTEYTPGNFTRDNLTTDVIRFDMNVIKHDLFCNSVRIYGKEIDLLIVAAGIALESGLHVWLSPRLINSDVPSTSSYLKNVSIAFEQLRQKFSKQELILIIGGELSIDMISFVKGETIHQRITNLLTPVFFFKSVIGIKPSFQKIFDNFLAESVLEVRKHFKGKITYASASWEKVDWSIFDIASINLYKADFNKSFFLKQLKKINSTGRPLAITEFGCCTYVGAEKKGPAGYTVLNQSTNPPVFKKKCERSEQVQADYILDSLHTFEKEKVEATFVFDFYMQKFKHDNNPDSDYDKASFGITKSIGENKWQAKESFNVIANYYKNK